MPSPWGIYPPYPLFHGGSERWNPHIPPEGGNESGRQRGYNGRGIMNTSPRSPIVEPGG